MKGFGTGSFGTEHCAVATRAAGGWPLFVLGSKQLHGGLLTNLVYESRQGFKPSNKSVANPFVLGY